jgi:hypothetical protein
VSKNNEAILTIEMTYLTQLLFHKRCRPETYELHATTNLLSLIAIFLGLLIAFEMRLLIVTSI